MESSKTLAGQFCEAHLRSSPLLPPNTLPPPLLLLPSFRSSPPLACRGSRSQETTLSFPTPSLSSALGLAMVRKQLDSRIPALIGNGVASNHRSFFVLVGDRGRDQVSNPSILEGRRALECIEGARRTGRKPKGGMRASSSTFSSRSHQLHKSSGYIPSARDHLLQSLSLLLEDESTKDLASNATASKRRSFLLELTFLPPPFPSSSRSSTFTSSSPKPGLPLDLQFFGATRRISDSPGSHLSLRPSFKIRLELQRLEADLSFPPSLPTVIERSERPRSSEMSSEVSERPTSSLPSSSSSPLPIFDTRSFRFLLPLVRVQPSPCLNAYLPSLAFLHLQLLQGLHQDPRSNLRNARSPGLRGSHSQLARQDRRDRRRRRNRRSASSNHELAAAALHHDHG